MKSVSAWMKEKWKDYILGVLHNLRGQVKALTYPLNIVYRPVQRRAPTARSSVLQISVGSLRFFFFNYKASDYFLVFPADNFIIITQKKMKVTREISILLLILTKKSEQ